MKYRNLQEIANKVGVSKMTISRYFNNKNSVSLETQNKIESCLKDSLYTVNRAPSIMAKKRSFAIGVVIPSFSNQVFSDFLRGIERFSRVYKYNVLIAHSGYRIDDEEKKVIDFLSYGVDGIILTSSIHTKKTIDILKNANIPIIETMDYTQNPIDLNIGFDHKQIILDATKAFIKSGRKCIAYFGARQDIRDQQRQLGYQIGISNIQKPIIYTSASQSSFSLGSEYAKKAINLHNNLDCIICTNDDLAVGALSYLKSINKKVPYDISILGFNNLNISQITQPMLSSIDTRRYYLGLKAANLILSKILYNKVNKFYIKAAFCINQGCSINANEFNYLSKNLLIG